MKDRANVAVLPPLIPLAAMGVGLLMDSLFPAAVIPRTVAAPFGTLLIIAAVFLVSAAAYELTKAHTAFDVRKATTTLVGKGVFRFSRNPVYFAMMLLCVGIALVANSLAMFVASFPAGSVLCLLVIRREEVYLEQKFGDRYLAYKASVRRWV
jgi:protein-S-isoprenylcysteine O-methyltransferase Ste14